MITVNPPGADESVPVGGRQRYHVHLAVFYETIRLWPGIPKNGRLVVQDDVLPELPEHGLPAVKLEKGDFVFWSDYHMMRSETVRGKRSVHAYVLTNYQTGLGPCG